MQAMLTGERYLKLFRNCRRFYRQNKTMLPHEYLCESSRRQLQSKSEQSIKTTAIPAPRPLPPHRPCIGKTQPSLNTHYSLFRTINPLKWAPGETNVPTTTTMPSFCERFPGETPSSSDRPPGDRVASKPPPIHNVYKIRASEERLPQHKDAAPKAAASKVAAPKSRPDIPPPPPPPPIALPVGTPHRPYNWMTQPRHNPDLFTNIITVRWASGKCSGPPKDPPTEKPPSFCESIPEPPCSSDPPPCEKVAPLPQSKPPPIDKDCKASEERLPCPKREPRKEKKKKQATQESSAKANASKDGAPKDSASKAVAPKNAPPKATAPKDAPPKAAAPKSAAPKDAAPKAAAPKDAAPKADASKVAAPKSRPDIPPPPPPPPLGVPVKKPQKPPSGAEPSPKPSPPPPPPPMPPAASQPGLIQYKSAMPTSPSPCERPPKEKEEEGTCTTEEPKDPSEEPQCPKEEKKPEKPPNPCLLAFMERNRLGGKPPLKGGCYVAKTSVRKSSKEEANSESKPSPKEGPSSKTKPSAKEGPKSRCKSSPKEGPSSKKKPSSKEGPSSRCKSSPKEEASSKTKPSSKEGPSSRCKPSPKEAASSKTKPSPKDGPSSRCKSSPKEEASPKPKPSPKEGPSSRCKPSPKEGPSSGCKSAIKEGASSGCKLSSKEGPSSVCKSSPKEGTSPGGKPSSKGPAGPGSKPPPKEAAKPSSKGPAGPGSKPPPTKGVSTGSKPLSTAPASPAGQSPSKGPASPGKPSSPQTVSKAMTTAAIVQPKVTANAPPPPPPPAPKLKAKAAPLEPKAKCPRPPPPPPPSVEPSSSQCTQAGGDQGHCEANKAQLLCQPVVPLKDTIQRYLCSIQPHLEPDEFLEEQKLTLEFQDGEGAKLQKMLEEVATCSSNWLTPRWTNAAYLGYRAPVTIFSSPCLTLPMQNFKTDRDYRLFTAKVIFGMCEFKELVDNNGIPVIKMCCHDLDNSQFRKIFGTVRKPGRFCDTIEQTDESQYVVVIHRNNFFKLPVIGEDCKIVHVHSLADQLGSIIHCPMERGVPIGLLTHDNRDNWGEAYTYLCRPEGNNESIVHAIEQSLFVVCLDDCVNVPKKGASAVHAAQLLHGGGRHQNSANRWMDKTIQLIVNPNGMAGFCYEHAPADCQPLAMLMDFVQRNITQPNYGCQCCSTSKTKPATVLCFDRISECVDLFLCEAKRTIDKISSRLQLHVFKYGCHGKSFIKAQGLNADSYIQMALQLAYYNFHRKLPAQYESAHLRMFEEGRTETIRSTSRESRAFVEAMALSPGSNKRRLMALRSAVDSHQELTKLALQGRGIDRHLLGLQQMAKENGLPTPEFFKSKGFAKSVSFQVFSSQVASSHDAFMAYGPLIANGYGCCYNPRDKEIIFSISAWGSNKETDPVLYGKAIEKALDAMRKLVLKTGGDRVGEDVCKCADEGPPN